MECHHLYFLHLLQFLDVLVPLDVLCLSVANLFLTSRNAFYDASNWVIETALATVVAIRNFILWCILAAWEGVVLSTLAAYYVTESTIYNLSPWFLKSRKSLKGKVVVITGGAGGLGQEIALRLARIKARVVVWDNNEKGENSTMN